MSYIDESNVINSETLWFLLIALIEAMKRAFLTRAQSHFLVNEDTIYNGAQDALLQQANTS